MSLDFIPLPLTFVSYNMVHFHFIPLPLHSASTPFLLPLTFIPLPLHSDSFHIIWSSSFHSSRGKSDFQIHTQAPFTQNPRGGGLDG